MRTKTVIDGLKNSQKFRIIFKGDGSENDVYDNQANDGNVCYS